MSPHSFFSIFIFVMAYLTQLILEKGQKKNTESVNEMKFFPSDTFACVWQMSW